MLTRPPTFALRRRISCERGQCERDSCNWRRTHILSLECEVFLSSVRIQTMKPRLPGRWPNMRNRARK